jgi:hypothetical protein
VVEEPEVTGSAVALWLAVWGRPSRESPEEQLAGSLAVVGVRVTVAPWRSDALTPLGDESVTGTPQQTKPKNQPTRKQQIKTKIH